LSSLAFPVEASLQFPKAGRSLQSFVPPGWFILRQAKGDLNQDGQEDAALVVANKKEKDSDLREEDMPRYLLLLFKTTDGYQLSASSDKAILLKRDGGMLGDPFQELKIERGAVVFNFYGGSRDRWGGLYRFRYQNGDWYLIGKTIDTGDTMLLTNSSDDYNLVTGLLVRENSKEGGKVSVKREKTAPKPLIPLSKFDPFAEMH